MIRWNHPPERQRDRGRDGFDPVVEGERYRLTREVSLAIWERIRAAGCDDELSRHHFHATAARVAARGGRLSPEVGKHTLVGLALGDDWFDRVMHGVAIRSPGRESLVGVEAHRWSPETPSRDATAQEPGPSAPNGVVGDGGEPPGKAEVSQLLAAVRQPTPSRSPPASSSGSELRSAGTTLPWPSTTALPPAPIEPSLDQVLDLLRTGWETMAREPEPDERSRLPQAIRARMEQAFGQRFDDVEIHRNSGEVAAGEQAFTRGRHIYFEPGAFEPDSEHGEHVIAHELAHVAQQAQPSAAGRPATRGALEADAHQAAQAAVAGRAATVNLFAPPSAVLGFSRGTPRRAPAPRAPRSATSGAHPPAARTSGASPSRSAGPLPPRTAGATRPPSGQPVPATGARRQPGTGAPANVPAAAPRRGPGGDGVLMPEAPAALTPATAARLQSVGARNQTVAAAVTTLPTAEQQTAVARAAVEEPQAEQDARAQQAVVAGADSRPPPSPEIEAACDRIREVIRAKRPPSEDKLVEARPREMAQQAGQEMSAGVEQRAGTVRQGYADMQQRPQGTPGRAPVPATLPPERAQPPSVDAGAAAPEPLQQRDVSLDSDVAAQQRRLEDAGMTTAPAQLVQDGPIGDARGGVSDLQTMAQTNPQQVLADQAAAVATAQGDMRALQAAAVAAMAQARTGTVASMASHTSGVRASEEQQRAAAGAQMQAIFTRTQSSVDRLLQPLSGAAVARWDAGVAQLSTAFETALADVKRRIDERHQGDGSILGDIGAGLTSLGDSVFGLPGWVVESYDRAEAAFGDGATSLITDISRDVNQVIEDCKQLIAQARTEIDDIVHSLPANLQAWAQGEAARLGQQLDELGQRVDQTQQGLNRDLIDRASTAVQQVREQVAELREQARGLIGQIADAITAFLENPGKAIIDGLLRLCGIPPPSFWSLIDRMGNVIDGIAAEPMRFANTLMAGVGQGFQQFFSNLPSHLGHALFQWLFSKLGEAGVTVPADFSLRSILGLVLDVLGISWQRIRTILARHIGEHNAQLLDHAYQIITTLIERGPQGLIDMFMERFDPQIIVDMIKDMAIQYIMEAIVTRVTARILMMLNPAGAIIQAIEAIYRVVRWIIDNAARIFTLVESIVSGAEQILAGNTSGVANLVESSLVRLIVPVIDFLAGYLGLGGIPNAIRDLILGLQQRVEQIMDRVIGFVIERARALWNTVRSRGRTPDDRDSSGEEVPIPSALVEPRPANLSRVSPQLAQAIAAAGPGTVLYQRAGADPRQVTSTLLSAHPDARLDRATGQLTLPPVSAAALENASSLAQLGQEIARETGVSKVTLERSAEQVRFEGHINPHTAVGTLNLNDLRPGTGKKILLLGEANFSFARSLARQIGGAGMVATSYETGAEIRDRYQGAAANIQGAEENGVQIVHQVDAQAIDPNLGGPPPGFQHIVFNFPFVPGPRPTAAARNRTMLANFLRSATPALEAGGRIFVTSKEYWLNRFHLTESASAAGLRWVNPTSLAGHEDDGPTTEGHTGLGFDAAQFPGYEHRETHADESAEGTSNAITLIFTK